MVASSPGSGVDIVARIVAQRMSETLGAQMVIDNRPGAAGGVGVLNVAKAAPDGYTLLMAAPSLTISASLARDLPVDPVRDFAPVGQATTGHYVIVVHPSLPVHNVLTTAMNGRDMRDKLAVEGAEPAPSTPAEFGKHLAREVAIWGKVVKIAGVK